MSKQLTYYGSKQSVVPYRFLLDEIPSALRAYSIYKLANAYGGNALDTDASGGIGFDANNLIDTSAISAATDTVRRWIDQAGNRDVGNSTAGQQPRIKQSNVIETLNGVPALRFDGSNDGLGNNSEGTSNLFRVASSGFIAMVVNRDVNNASAVTALNIRTGTNSRADIRFRETTLAGNEGISVNGRRVGADTLQAIGISAYTANQIIVCAYFDWANAQLTLWENGVQTAQLTPFQTAGNTDNNGGAFGIGCSTTNAGAPTGNYLNGHIQECVIWQDAAANFAAANVSTVFSNINSRFNTY